MSNPKGNDAPFQHRILEKRLQLVNPGQNHDKYWRAYIREHLKSQLPDTTMGYTMVREWGRRGNKSQRTTEKFASYHLALVKFDNLVRSKTNKGYVLAATIDKEDEWEEWHTPSNMVVESGTRKKQRTIPKGTMFKKVKTVHDEMILDDVDQQFVDEQFPKDDTTYDEAKKLAEDL